jgi:molybdopterin synthase catalytic subunit
MAEQTLADLEAEARRHWPLVGCAIVHRLGELAVGETSVAIAASAAHRQQAFEAAEWIIDRIKQIVPIWKQEHLADGTSQWVHPGLDLPAPREEE